jgi:hypothetical protein
MWHSVRIKDNTNVHLDHSENREKWQRTSKETGHRLRSQMKEYLLMTASITTRSLPRPFSMIRSWSCAQLTPPSSHPLQARFSRFGHLHEVFGRFDPWLMDKALEKCG